MRDDELAEFSFDGRGRGRGREGGRECYEVTTWVDSIMCGERERIGLTERKTFAVDEPKGVWKTLNCEDMSNFSVVCLLLEVVSCLFFSFSGLWLK